MIQKIAKRDGRLVPFDSTKIERAIRKAGLETGEYEPAEAARLSRITQDRLPHDKAPGVELIQDTVERTLIDEGYVDTARAYIAYRERRAQARRDLENSVDVNKSINEYIGRSDWRVNANANQGYNLGGLILNASGKMMANYWLGHIYPKAVGEAHRNGDIHIHDLDILGGYCFTGDTRVWTPDGKNPTFKELVDNGVDQLWVYAYNRVKHKAARAIAIKPRVTRHVDELVEVTLMTGELIRCTPDHQIMTHNGEYKRARELKVGNALMPLDHVDNMAEPIVRECNTVKLDEPIPVYDLTVPGYSNFALYGPNVFVHNCAGWSLRTLLREGFNGVANKIESAPPKHLSSALGQMVNFLGTLQNEWAGAQAFSSADTYLAPYIRVDNLTQDEVEQCMQNFVFSMNVPSRWGGQCPFTNLTFDLVCPDDLRDVHPEVGGVMQDFTYGELQHEMDMINRAFVHVMCAGDLHGRVFTFPIPTYNITDDFDWDSPITDEIFEMTAKYGLPYFQNFLNSDMDPHMVRSMCPMPANTKVLVREGLRKAWHISDIQNLDRNGKLYDVLCNGEVHKVRINQFDGLEFMRLKLANGHEATFSTNHTNRVLRKDENGAFSILEMPTDAIQEGDYLPFETHPVEGEGYDYETGFFVGAYLGDGSHISENALILSLNDTTKMSVAERVSKFARERFGVDAVLQDHEGKHLVSLRLNSRVMTAIVDDMIKGRTALEKAISPKVIAMSLEFRKGILDGLMATDGNVQKKRIYTASETGARNLCTMLASMGIPTNVAVDDRTANSGKLSDNPVWCVRTYDANSQQSRYGNTFVKTNDAMWFSVTEIEHLSTRPAAGYCFEVVDGTEPLFMLPDGLITHNCRLRLDVSELLKRGNGLFGSAEQTGSIGVVTMNMARLGYEHAGDKKGLYEQLDYLLNLAKVSLELKRKTVSELMERGLYPFTARYLGTFRNHFSTIGVNGINELIRNYTHDEHDITDDVGHQMAAELLDHIREKMVEFQTETGHMYNLEATPGEGACYRFAREDIKRHPDIIHAGTDERPYYTNSSQLPVNYTSDPFLALEMQQDLQAKYTGGTVLHLYLGERVSSAKAAKALVHKSLANFAEPYITLTPTFSVCPRHGYIAGEHKWCPKCDEELKASHSHQ